MYKSSCHHPSNQWCKNRSQHRGSHRHSDRQSQVTLCQISNDIGSSTARAASYQDDPQSQFWRQMEYFRQYPSHHRHNDKLCQTSYDDILRTTEHNLEVIGIECQAHTKHHQSQQRIDINRIYPYKTCRQQ